MLKNPLIETLLANKSKSERTRLRLLWAGLECCAKEGFEGLSFMKTAELAGTDKRTALHYFSTRQEFLAALLEFLGVVGRAYTAEFIEVRSGIKDPLERYVRATFDWFRSEPSSANCWLAAVQRASYDADFSSRMADIAYAARVRITVLLAERKGRRPKARSSKKADDRAYCIHAAMVGCLFSVNMSDHKLEKYEAHCWRVVQGIADRPD